MNLINKKYFFSLQNEFYDSYIGEYFKVIKYKNIEYIYYNSRGDIKVYDNKTKQRKVVLKNVINSGFTIINKNNILYLFAGCQITLKFILQFKNSKKMVEYLDSLKKYTEPIENHIYNHNELVLKDDYSPKIPINGIYIFSSNDGFKWSKLTSKPIMTRFNETPNIKLGQINFDTMPGLIKFKDSYLYFGRLNTSRQKREIYVRISSDLFTWNAPIKLNILNPFNNHYMKSYYFLVPFIYKNELYGICNYFETIDGEKYQFKNCCHIILKSKNIENWVIIKKIMEQNDSLCPYKDRITNVLVNKNIITIYVRENLKLPHQKFYKFNLKL